MITNVIEYINQRLSRLYFNDFRKDKNIIYSHDFINKNNEINYYSDIICLNCRFNRN